MGGALYRTDFNVLFNLDLCAPDRSDRQDARGWGVIHALYFFVGFVAGVAVMGYWVVKGWDA